MSKAAQNYLREVPSPTEHPLPYLGEAGLPKSFSVELPAIALESGGRVEAHRLQAWSWGPAQKNRAPTVLLVQPLETHGTKNWWADFSGPEQMLDPRRMRLLSFNNLGAGKGSAGPQDERFAPTKLSTWDLARSILLALDALEIDKIHLVVGPSLGGMVTLALLALAPHRFERALSISAAAYSSAWLQGIADIQAQMLQISANDETLELSAKLDILLSSSPVSLQKFSAFKTPNSSASTQSDQPNLSSFLEQEAQARHQGLELAETISQLQALGRHDLRTPPKVRNHAESWLGIPSLRKIKTAQIMVGVDSDRLVASEEVQQLSQPLKAQYRLLKSVHGHLAYRHEPEQLALLLHEALQLQPLN